MKMNGGAYFAIFVMLISLAIALGAFAYPLSATRRIPILMGTIIFVLAGITLIRELRSAKKQSNEDKEEEPPLSSYWQTGAWVLGVGVGIYLVGFLVAIPLFIISFLRLNGSRWWTSAIIAGCTTVIIYVVFEYLLQVHLYRGLFFNL